MFTNRMPRYEPLAPEAIDLVERGWKRLVSEIGVQFDEPRALELFRAAGQEVEGDLVRFDPEFVLEQVAQGAARVLGCTPAIPSTTCTSAAIA